MKKRLRRRAELIHAVQELEPRQLLSYSINSDSAVILNTSLGEIAVELYNDGTEPATIANFLSYVAAGTYNGTIFHRVTSNGDSNGDTFGIVQGGGFSDSTGTLTPVTTTTGLTQGLSYATLNLSDALTTTIPSGTTLTLINTTDSSTQNVVLAADADSGGTTLSVNSFTANDTYASGSGIDNGTTSIGVTLTGGTTAPIALEATPTHPNSVGTIAMARTSGLNSATSQFFFNTTDNSTVFDNNSADSTYNPYAAFGNVIRGLGIVDTIDGLSTSNTVTSSDGESLSPPETSTGGYVTINTATEEDTMTVTIGPNDAAGDHTVSFRDPSTGAGSNISLNGADATLTFTGTDLAASRSNGNLTITGTNLELQEISSTDTTAKTNLVFSNPGRNKYITLGEINITGSLNSISGAGVNLTGDIAVTGGVNKIDLLASNAAGYISIDTDSVANAPETFIDIPFLSDISIQSGGAIKELITRSYAVDDGTTRGISASGNIAKVLVYGSMEASIESNGNIGKILAGQTEGTIEAGGTIGTIEVAQMEGGNIYAGEPYDAKTLDIKSIKSDTNIQDTRIIAAGNIGPIKTGSMSGSAVVAGADFSGDDQAADGFGFALASNAYIKSISLKTPKGSKNTSFSDSEIEAYQIDSLRLGRVATTVGSTYPVLGIQAVNLKSLVATTDQKQSLDLSNITSQTTLDALIAKRKLKLNTTAAIGTLAGGSNSTTGLTAGESYSSIGLTDALATAIPAGTVVTIVSGSNTQTATLSADANVGDTSLTVTSFTANATYASGSNIEGTQTTTTDLTAGDTYSAITLSAALVTAIPSGTVVTVVSGSDSQAVTLSADANPGDTSLTVTPFTANAEYAAGSTIEGTDAATTTTGLTLGDTYSAITLNSAIITPLAVGTVVTIVSGGNMQTATLSAAASTGDTSLTVTPFIATADYPADSTVEGTDAINITTTTGLTSNDPYTTITLNAPIVTPLAVGATITIVSGSNTQSATLSAAADTGDTSLTVTAFTANADYPANSTVEGTDADTTTGLTSGDTYTTLTLSDTVATAEAAGSIITITSGSSTQTATLAAAASVGDSSLTVDAFTASADYASGSAITDANGDSVGTLASGTTSGNITGTLAGGITTPLTTGLTSGDSYATITLNAPIVTPLAVGAVVTIVSGDNSQSATLSAAADTGDTSLTVNSFTANAEYPANSIVEGTDADTTTGLTSGDTYTTLTLSDTVATAEAAGSTITITSGSSTQTATLAAAANVGDSSLTIDTFTANADYASGSAITDIDGNSVGTLAGGTTTTTTTGTLATGTTTTTGTLASGTTTTTGTVNGGITVDTLTSSTGATTGLTAGTAYTTIALSSPLTTAPADGQALTISSGNSSQLVTLGAAGNVGDISLTVNSFIANGNYPAGSTINDTGFTIDIIPTSDLGVPSPTSSS